MRTLKTMGAALLVGFFALSADVQAESIAVVNPGFTYTTGTSSNIGDYPTADVNTQGWNAPALNGGVAPISFYANQSKSYIQMVCPGWYSTGVNGRTGVQTLDSSYWLGGISPSGAVGYVSMVGGTTGNVYQTITGALLANTSYTLTMDLYSRSGGFPSGHVSIYLADGNGTALSGSSLTVVDPTSLAAGSATYTVTTGSITPGDLRIVATLTSGVGNYTSLNIDNVALSGVTVPEPGTMTLAVCCLIGLLCYAWRKRR